MREDVPKPTLLVCPPEFYGIEYEINPWMNRERAALPEAARAQWAGLDRMLRSLGCGIEALAPVRGLPDMVFTANAGLVAGRKFIRSNFRFPQRQREQSYFEAWFAQRQYQVLTLPADLCFEGEGDALFCGDTLFCGYRVRSDIRAHRLLGEMLGCLVVSVELVQDRFYHLDTCFAPLSDGQAIWYPDAFDAYAQSALREHIGELLEVSADETGRFACNAVVVGRQIVLPEGCPKLCDALRERGYTPHTLPMGEFLKAGGACKCLVLFLPQRP